MIPLITDINGPNAQKLIDEAYYLSGVRFLKKAYPECKFPIENGSNLKHKKYPFSYEYQFDLNVKMLCGSEQGTLRCKNVISETFYGHFTSKQPKCKQFF